MSLLKLKSKSQFHFMFYIDKSDFFITQESEECYLKFLKHIIWNVNLIIKSSPLVHNQLSHIWTKDASPSDHPHLTEASFHSSSSLLTTSKYVWMQDRAAGSLRIWLPTYPASRKMNAKISGSKFLLDKQFFIQSNICVDCKIISKFSKKN